MTTIPADKLDKLVSRWQTVQGTLAAGADQDSYVRLSREFAELDPIVATITALRKAIAERADLQQLVDDPASDPEMSSLAEAELGTLDPKIDELERQLKVQLLPKDAADEKSAILELRAGTGGEEAALFAGDLFRMYQRYADRRGWKVERPIRQRIRDRRLSRRSSPTSPARACSRASSSNPACIACSACRRPRRKAASTPRRRPWRCCPRPRRSTSRSTTRICASTSFRASGPGGQSVNTTDSAVQDHPPAHRHSWSASQDEKSPAQEQGQGHEGAARQPLRA